MKRLAATVLLLVFLSSAFLLWWNNGTAPVNPQDTKMRIFVIRQGEGMRQIANSLKTQGFINDPTVFFLLVKRLGLDGKIQAGSFRLSPAMNAPDIAKALTHGTLDIWVTIPEGKRAEEIADILKAKLPTYQESWRSTLDANEGYLFPDTYLFPKDAQVDTIVKLMRGNFDKKYSEIPNKTTMSQTQLVTIASLIEREAKHGSDRALVSSVIYNRLDEGMALGIDASIQYALGYDQVQKTWWKKDLTVDDLAIASAYNTRTHTGLPPTPIANPGLESLMAAANPANTDYLYYFSDKTGQNHYAKTFAEQNDNIKKYGL